jgi:hypothetical protein
MREILEQERAFTARIRRASLTAWALTLLLPVGLVAERMLAFVALGEEGPTAADFAMYIGTQMLTFVGSIAAVIGVITLVAWLFRTRMASVAALQLRVGDLEQELAVLQQERRQS